MVIFESFVWYQDQYVYHLTRKDFMGNIVERGLVPKCGEHSVSVGDFKKAIHFFGSMSSLDFWITELYNNKDVPNLEILKFNLKRRKWHVGDTSTGDFYTTNSVSKEGIDYLQLVSPNSELLSLDQIGDNATLVWKPLASYKVQIK